MACDDYHQATIRTGYEYIVPQRTTDMFAFSAKKPGFVREVNKHGVIVDYDDGTTQGFEVGQRFGSAAGLTLIHDVVTPLKKGDRFDVGDAIVYNTGFFEPDFFDPKKIVYKTSMDINTVLWESSQTHEDASSVSLEVGERMTTTTAKVKYVQLRFDQAISNLVKEGDQVDADTTLCLIQDAVTADNNLFDEKSLETLKTLASNSPKAKVKGTVARIEVYYHGELEDMSKSLREVATWSDRQFKSRAQQAGRTGYTGFVDDGFRIEGVPLAPDTLAIKFYISTRVKLGTGDKLVFANQLKSVAGDVFEGELRTESGKPIGAKFGGKSVEARIVNSPYDIASTAGLLYTIRDQAVEIYRGKRPAKVVKLGKTAN